MRSRLTAVERRLTVGAYERPFSGVGEEFSPLGIAPGETGIVLHETGYWSKNRHWNFPDVYSPFWRAMYNYKTGHSVRFGKRLVELDKDRYDPAVVEGLLTAHTEGWLYKPQERVKVK